jgi:hypothetical protein
LINVPWERPDAAARVEKGEASGFRDQAVRPFQYADRPKPIAGRANGSGPVRLDRAGITVKQRTKFAGVRGEDWRPGQQPERCFMIREPHQDTGIEHQLRFALFGEQPGQFRPAVSVGHGWPSHHRIAAA